MTGERRTFLFMPESAYGPTNNCIGIGNELLKRGHRVVFAAERSWEGRLSALGFEEDLVDLAPAPEEDVEQDAGQFWKDYIKEVSPEFRKTTAEQLETVTLPIWEALVDGAKYCEPQLNDIIARVRPDVIVEDNVLAFPALVTAGVPFVRIVSCNPLEVPGDDIAPVFSGLAKDDREGWASFRAEYDRTHRALWEAYDAWVQEQGAPPLPELEFIHEGDENLYVYPEVLDYTDERPLGEHWHRLDSSVRETEQAPADLPASFTDGSPPARVLQPRLARQRRRRAHAARDRRARGPADQRHRLEGPAARRVRARRQHVGRRVPAADEDPAARRPRDHARRQQHDDRGAALRQAHGRAAAVLGPVRQRPARARAGLRHPARPLPLHARGAAGSRAGAARRSRLRERIAAVGADIRSRAGVAAAADVIERVVARERV
jgi:UDP:flavonoid glycosyltransferase YjiC (YdhE family)